MNRRASVVDLTQVPPPILLRTSAEISPSLTASPAPLNLSESYAMPRGTKRKRRNGEDVPARSEAPNEVQSPIEAIDLTEVEDSSSLAQALAKQRQDAIQAQATDESDKSRSLLAAYQCPVCMDNLEDATSTSCGHLFCHKCIVDYLQSVEDRRVDHTKQSKGTCPVCRKTITSNDSSGPRRSLIPLKLRVITKKRNRVAPGQA
ncbi:hypothetical protein POX_d05385 [Penicillium oxalicum]|uniref:RING-type domain-containing protein n=1 Tax=Penicillium oxalicum (strain 114-2 / CGMCC 5302) TaxID=933388 RepID=S7ZPY1_PENO1|nr:hypothetical protein POX_d05385 [Penicillium oxalicum]EPS32454.1 hypothetical protein PDE_07414 [Penicillium oxalicum 114-2]KAI2789886.1 hypothetical protein POX_d05385 [Penicillium oxalicum]